MLHAAMIFLGGLLLASAILAAVPPLSRERMTEQSSLVAVGRIAAVNIERITGTPEFVDSIYSIDLLVERVEKGDPSLAGKTIKARTWQPAERPRGWAGPQGQNVTPQKGSRVRCHLTGPQGDTYELLVPNGLESLAPPSTTPSTSPR